MTLRYHFSILLAGGILISGCKTAPDAKSTRSTTAASSVTNAVVKPQAVSKKNRPAEPVAEQRAEAIARFATAVSYELNDKPDLALDEYYRAALADPQNEGLVTQTALRLLQANRTEKAIDVLHAASGDPDASASVIALLARSYFQNGQTNQAIAAGISAIKRDPAELAGYQTLADIHFQAGNIEELVKVLNHGAKQSKADAAFLVGLAETYTRYIQLQPKSAETLKPHALVLVKRAADLKPDNGVLLQKLAESFSVLGERQTAAEIYVKLLGKYSQVPAMRDALREKLANIYLLSSDKEHAAEQLQAIIRDNPTRYPQAFYVLGTIAFDQRKFDEAADYFSKALVIVPDLEQAYYDLAAAQLNGDKPHDALGTLQRVKKKYPKSFIGEFYAGLASQKVKDYASAVKHFTAAEIIGKAGDKARLDSHFYFQFGAACERNRDYEQAEKYFRAALDLKPDDAETLNYLGYMWADRGVKLDKAEELIAKALKLEPENHAYLDSMGWVLFKLSRYDQALSFLLKAVNGSKDADPVLYDHLGDVYSALKQPDKAREAWQKSLTLEPSEEVKKKLSLSL